MSSPAEDIMKYLEQQGHGTFGTDLFVSREPAGPDFCLTGYDTPGGLPPDPDCNIEQPTVQVRVRARTYPQAYAALEAAKNELITPKGFTFNGYRYVGVWGDGDIGTLGYDDNDRSILVFNVNIIREEL